MSNGSARRERPESRSLLLLLLLPAQALPSSGRVGRLPATALRRFRLCHSEPMRRSISTESRSISSESFLSDWRFQPFTDFVCSATACSNLSNNSALLFIFYPFSPAIISAGRRSPADAPEGVSAYILGRFARAASLVAPNQGFWITPGAGMKAHVSGE